jgi:hypothetical protein
LAWLAITKACFISGTDSMLGGTDSSFLAVFRKYSHLSARVSSSIETLCSTNKFVKAPLSQIYLGFKSAIDPNQ